MICCCGSAYEVMLVWGFLSCCSIHMVGFWFVKEELKNLPPEAVICDIENLDTSPPLESNISNRITNLSDYFITSDDKDLFEVHTRLKTVKKVKKNIQIRTL